MTWTYIPCAESRAFHILGVHLAEKLYESPGFLSTSHENGFQSVPGARISLSER
jgi:hypothetical protein